MFTSIKGTVVDLIQYIQSKAWIKIYRKHHMLTVEKKGNLILMKKRIKKQANKQGPAARLINWSKPKFVRAKYLCWMSV